MIQRISAVTLLVRDYDEAIGYFTRTLGFAPGGGHPAQRHASAGYWSRRAARPAPAFSSPRRRGRGRRRASATRPAAASFSSWRPTTSAATMPTCWRRGVRFIEEPRYESYGTVAVFEDLYGNRWDLVEPKRQPPVPQFRFHARAGFLADPIGQPGSGRGMAVRPHSLAFTQPSVGRGRHPHRRQRRCPPACRCFRSGAGDGGHRRAPSSPRRRRRSSPRSTTSAPSAATSDTSRSGSTTSSARRRSRCAGRQPRASSPTRRCRSTPAAALARRRRSSPRKARAAPRSRSISRATTRTVRARAFAFRSFTQLTDDENYSRTTGGFEYDWRSTHEPGWQEPDGGLCGE